MDTNFVVGGQYAGTEIKIDSNSKAYLDGYKIYFDKANVIRMEKINEEASSFKGEISYWLGSVTAAGLSDVKDLIIKITWRNNTESLIKVRESIYTAIVATSMEEIASAYHISTEDEVKEGQCRKETINQLHEINKNKGIFISQVINNPKKESDILEILPICTKISDSEKQYNLISFLSSSLLVDDIRLVDFIRTCNNFIQNYGDTTDPSNPKKYLQYMSVQSIEYTTEKVRERLKIYSELGDYKDCKQIITAVGDYNNPDNVAKYMDYLKNVEKYFSHNSIQEMEDARRALENMGDYLEAKSLADKNKFKELAEFFFPEASKSDIGNNATSTTKNEKSGCYVATCVYGSYDCPEVWTLRRFRDNTLGSTWYGRAFIRTYYAISPLIVKWFGNTVWFKKMWRGTLDRMVKKLEANGVENTPYEDKKW